MKITPKVKKFQQGGTVAPEAAPVEDPNANGGAPVEGGAPEAAPEAGGQEDPMVMLAQMSMQALQNQDCQAAMQVCQAFIQIVQQMQGQAPQEPQGEPVFARHGAKIVARIKK